MFIPDRIIQSALMANSQRILSLDAWKRWFKVNFDERIGYWPVLNYILVRYVDRKPDIGRRWKHYSHLGYAGNRYSSRPRRMGFSLGDIPAQVGLRDECWSTGPAKYNHYQWLLHIKQKQKVIFRRRIQIMMLQTSLDSLSYKLWKRSIGLNFSRFHRKSDRF